MHACIDLGSNSFHLLIGEWENGQVRIVERCSEKVQLGEGVATTGNISLQAFSRGIHCLEHFSNLMAKYPLEQYWALGTNTFRVSQNAQQFIAAAEERGIRLSVISGVQEAVLIYAGVISALPASTAHRLVVDIGGGSTEIIVGREHSRLFTASLRIGSVAWRDRFFSQAGTDSQALQHQMEAAVNAAKEVFAEAAPGIRKAGWSEAYASSGTVKMLASICAANGHNPGQIQLDVLRQLQPKIANAIAENVALPGLKEKRRDLLLAGWSVMVGLMEAYAIETIVFSATALREGMLDFMVKNVKTLGAMEYSNLPAVNYAKIH